LEQQFIFDPTRGVPARARIKVETEIDELRLGLEHELSSGAYHLRRIGQEIEDSRRKLSPLLADARQSLAQAETDLAAVAKSISLRTIIIVLVTAFFVGTFMEPWDSSPAEYAIDDRPANPGVVVEGVSPPSVNPPVADTAVSQERQDQALKEYRQGTKLMRREKFKEAAGFFQRATELDPQLAAGFEDLGYAWYRLGKYDESIKALQTVLKSGPSYDAYYYLGLDYTAQKKWSEARDALLNAIGLSPVDQWGDKHTEAYYYLGMALTKLGEAPLAIHSLENDLRQNPELTIERLALGNLYLFAGKREAARTQYTELKVREPKLAKELRKLMIRHGVS